MLRDSQQTGRLRLRHLQEHTEARGEDMAEQRARFHRLAREDSAPRVVSAFNLFQTPEPLAAHLVELLQPSGRILEPSAGLGRLYRAVRAVSDCPVTLVDVSPDCCRELYATTAADPVATLIQGDFLEMDSGRLGGQFDRIVMNPPFKMGRDVKHITHAATMLRPGGRLVTLCAAGQRQRAALEHIGQWIDLPPGTFKTEGTSVSAAIVVITR